MNSRIEQTVHQNRNYHEIKSLRKTFDHNMRNTAKTLQHITLTIDSVARKIDNLVIRFSAYTTYIEFLPLFPPDDLHRRFTLFPFLPEIRTSPRLPVSILFTPSGAPQYTMANIITVYDLWHKWTVRV